MYEIPPLQENNLRVGAYVEVEVVDSNFFTEWLAVKIIAIEENDIAEVHWIESIMSVY